MPPAIVWCEYARDDFMVQAVDAGWCAPASSSSTNALPERGTGFAPANERRRRAFLERGEDNGVVSAVS
jgi:hypothetical protein